MYIKKGNIVKKVSYVMNTIAVIFVIGIGIKSMDTFSLKAVGFLLLAISPYLYGSLLTKLVSNQNAIVLTTFVVLVLAMGGSYLLLDAMYIHPDPQGALAFVVIPVYQWGLLLLATLPIYLFNKKGKE